MSVIEDDSRTADSLAKRDRPARRLGPLGRLGRLTFRRRGATVLVWLAVLVATITLSALYSGDFNADYSAPGSDSQAAQQVLEDRFPGQSGDVVTVVVRADEGAEAA